MDRKAFLQLAGRSGVGCCALAVLGVVPSRAEEPAPPSPLQHEKTFTDNWLSDLMDTIEGELDEPTRVRLLEGCGRGCYRRHSFKQDIARAGQGSVDKLLEAYRKNFEVWRDGTDVHVRYGAVSKGCYCPVLKTRANDGLHCHCTKATHQAIFEAALGRRPAAEILETVRRGGQTCHFVFHLEA
jgi:hypothetical protein